MPTSGTLHIDLVYFLRDCNPSTRLFFTFSQSVEINSPWKLQERFGLLIVIFIIFTTITSFQLFMTCQILTGCPWTNFFWQSHTVMPKNRPFSTFLSLKNDHIFTQIGSDDLTRTHSAMFKCGGLRYNSTLSKFSWPLCWYSCNFRESEINVRPPELAS